LRRRPSLRGDDKSWNFDVSSLAGRNTQWEKGKNIALGYFIQAEHSRAHGSTDCWVAGD
jgi:hypothetical protein